MADDSPRVVVTRRAEQAAALCEKLVTAGLEPVVFPTIRLAALPSDDLDAALDDLTAFDWLVFTSVNAVDYFFRRVETLGKTSNRTGDAGEGWPSIAVVGKATAQALIRHDLRPDFMPVEFTGAALATELDEPAGKRILLPRAKAGGSAIVDGLRVRGASVTDIGLYDTVTAAPTAEALNSLNQGFEAITFASPSSVRGFVEIASRYGPELQEQIRAAAIACIGPVTRDAAHRYRLPVALMPDEFTLDALVQCLAQYFGRTKIHDRSY